MQGFKALVLISVVAFGHVAGENELNQAGQQFGAAFQNIGAYFVRQYKTVQDFFALSKDELDKKVQDTADFLRDVKANMAGLMNDARQKADNQLQAALNNVDKFSQDVANFQTRLKASTQATQAQVQQLESDWKNQASSMYNEGLDKIIQAAQAAKATGGSFGIHANGFFISSALVLFVVKFLLQ